MAVRILEPGHRPSRVPGGWGERLVQGGQGAVLGGGNAIHQWLHPVFASAEDKLALLEHHNQDRKSVV